MLVWIPVARNFDCFLSSVSLDACFFLTGLVLCDNYMQGAFLVYFFVLFLKFWLAWWMITVEQSEKKVSQRKLASQFYFKCSSRLQNALIKREEFASAITVFL
ncbi:hypothetical protein B0T26DRAFT_228832 [Lasiosphaeria miniovina]|uniref:Uncharacterized protein n=1 Tax=Lasiosphaeria miniovina TaxID=1954250 RepID=A0AA40AVF5_9PEZI|nr:uncharacterized protein B0T26DRAFT_228832 [Lasiosphaeria miniovina]KAK0722678.1 hypothetical protein B0T26DRAFT_228832 [Lasiosphaeria miniovina]